MFYLRIPLSWLQTAYEIRLIVLMRQSEEVADSRQKYPERCLIFAPLFCNVHAASHENSPNLQSDKESGVAC